MTTEKTTHIQNNAARLITFSWNRKKYKLMPAGKPVKVPVSALNSAFLKTLMKDREVTEVKDLTDEETAAAELAQLQTDAKLLGVEFDDDTSPKKLAVVIKKAEEEKAEAAELAEKEKEEAAENAKLEAIREQAKTLGIEFDDDWTVEDISLAIEFDALATKAKSLGIKVKDGWSLEELQAEVTKKEK